MPGGTRSRTLRVLVVALALVVAGCAGTGTLPEQPGATTAPSDTATYEVTVERVVDGDTLEVTYANGTEETIRLVGVDTPEVHVENDPPEFEGVPDTEAGRSCLRDWGHRASEFARTELLGETVTLALDPSEGPRDRYDRLLAYVATDGERSFNYQLVAQGYARVYDSQFTRRDAFYAAESAAQGDRVGLWACRSPDAGGNGGATTATRTTTRAVADGGSPLALARIHADADGNDNENLNDEYLVFENAGDEPIDLSGWSVRDEAGHAYRVPAGVTLAPNATLTLYTGSGTDTDSALYWGSKSAIWNNGGDTILVADANGTVVLEESYS